MAIKYSVYSMKRRLLALTMLVIFFAVCVISRLFFLQVTHTLSATLSNSFPKSVFSFLLVSDDKFSIAFAIDKKLSDTYLSFCLIWAQFVTLKKNSKSST